MLVLRAIVPQSDEDVQDVVLAVSEGFDSIRLLLPSEHLTIHQSSVTGDRNAKQTELNNLVSSNSCISFCNNCSFSGYSLS